MPVHGEWRHLRAHAALAHATGVPDDRVAAASTTAWSSTSSTAWRSRWPAGRLRLRLRRRPERRRRRRGVSSKTAASSATKASSRHGRRRLDHRQGRRRPEISARGFSDEPGRLRRGIPLSEQALLDAALPEGVPSRTSSAQRRPPGGRQVGQRHLPAPPDARPGDRRGLIEPARAGPSLVLAGDGSSAWLDRFVAEHGGRRSVEASSDGDASCSGADGARADGRAAPVPADARAGEAPRTAVCSSTPPRPRTSRASLLVRKGGYAARRLPRRRAGSPPRSGSRLVQGRSATERLVPAAVARRRRREPGSARPIAAGRRRTADRRGCLLPRAGPARRGVVEPGGRAAPALRPLVLRGPARWHRASGAGRRPGAGRRRRAAARGPPGDAEAVAERPSSACRPVTECGLRVHGGSVALMATRGSVAPRSGGGTPSSKHTGAGERSGDVRAS